MTQPHVQTLRATFTPNTGLPDQLFKGQAVTVTVPVQVIPEEQAPLTARVPADTLTPEHIFRRSGNTTLLQLTSDHWTAGEHLNQLLRTLSGQLLTHDPAVLTQALTREAGSLRLIGSHLYEPAHEPLLKVAFYQARAQPTLTAFLGDPSALRATLPTTRLFRADQVTEALTYARDAMETQLSAAPLPPEQAQECRAQCARLTSPVTVYRPDLLTYGQERLYAVPVTFTYTDVLTVRAANGVAAYQAAEDLGTHLAQLRDPRGHAQVELHAGSVMPEEHESATLILPDLSLRLELGTLSVNERGSVRHYHAGPLAIPAETFLSACALLILQDRLDELHLGDPETVMIGLTPAAQTAAGRVLGPRPVSFAHRAARGLIPDQLRRAVQAIEQASSDCAAHRPLPPSEHPSFRHAQELS